MSQSYISYILIFQMYVVLLYIYNKNAFLLFQNNFKPVEKLQE